MKNLLNRGIDILNGLGLLCGGIAVLFLGVEFKNSFIFFIGGLSIVLFALFLIFSIILLIRDYQKHGEKIIPRKF